jgi:hypothetical protein
LATALCAAAWARASSLLAAVLPPLLDAALALCAAVAAVAAWPCALCAAVAAVVA